MAPTKPQISSQIDKNRPMPVPRLETLFVRNFRNIGSEGLEIDCQHLIILAGYQTIDDRSITGTYEVMHNDTIQPPLVLDVFHNGMVDKENLPEVELHSILHKKSVDAQWLNKIKENEFLFKEKWIWENPDIPPIHYVFNTETNDWALLNIAKPGEFNLQDNKIKLSLLAIMDRALGIQNHTNSKTSEHQKLVEKLKQLQDETIKEYKNKFDI